MWHCPHCGALQTEAARCWVCRRSSTTCSTCRNFRRSLATDVGFCSLDRRRRPLTGLELRGCWAGRPPAPEVSHVPTRAQLSEGLPAVRGFVPVDEVRLPAAVQAAVADETPVPPIAFVEIVEAPTSLFGDAER
jgi:hypothetical protein